MTKQEAFDQLINNCKKVFDIRNEIYQVEFIVYNGDIEGFDPSRISLSTIRNESGTNFSATLLPTQLRRELVNAANILAKNIYTKTFESGNMSGSITVNRKDLTVHVAHVTRQIQYTSGFDKYPEDINYKDEIKDVLEDILNNYENG